MSFDTESIEVRQTEDEVVVSLSVRSGSMSTFQTFDGCGDTLSLALFDLAEQVEAAYL